MKTEKKKRITTMNILLYVFLNICIFKINIWYFTIHYACDIYIYKIQLVIYKIYIGFF